MKRFHLIIIIIIIIILIIAPISILLFSSALKSKNITKIKIIIIISA